MSADRQPDTTARARGQGLIRVARRPRYVGARTTIAGVPLRAEPVLFLLMPLAVAGVVAGSIAFAPEVVKIPAGVALGLAGLAMLPFGPEHDDDFSGPRISAITMSAFGFFLTLAEAVRWATSGELLLVLN